MLGKWLDGRKSEKVVQNYLNRNTEAIWRVASSKTYGSDLSKILSSKMKLKGLSDDCPYSFMLAEYNMGLFNQLANLLGYSDATVGTSERFKEFLLSLESRVTVEEYRVVNSNTGVKLSLCIIKGRYFTLGVFESGKVLFFDFKRLPSSYEVPREEYIVDFALELTQLYRKEDKALCESSESF